MVKPLPSPFACACAFAFAACLATGPRDAEAAPPARLESRGEAALAASNAYAQILVEAEAPFNPEEASFFGIPGFDDAVVDLRPGLAQRSRAALSRAKRSLAGALEKEHDRALREDLAILIGAADLEMATRASEERVLLTWVDAPLRVFEGLSALLRDQVASDRRRHAMARLRRYVGQAPGATSIFVLARERYEERARDRKLLRPVRREVERALGNAQVYLDGVRDLVAREQDPEAPALLAALAAQVASYTEWTRAVVLPATRQDPRVPRELYVQRLRAHGVDIDPNELVRRAAVEYAETRAALVALAPRVAEAKGIPSQDYREVLRALKARALPVGEIESHYRQVLGELEGRIEAAAIVTLPRRPMQMRLASEAESAASPPPHFLPPALVGNRGEQGVFVLTRGPAREAAAGGYDDFANAAASWTLTAHEGRPGHELQFSAMIERGLPLARTRYAFNSVNIEGWALYAEAEVLALEPVEGQLFALQHRLLRAARAMLDPQLNLGTITRERAQALLRDEVVLSAAMVEQELDRYTFAAPGQACAYFYGYARLLELRMETELALGPAFDRRAFHDFVLAQGLVTPDLLATAVRDEFVGRATVPRP